MASLVTCLYPSYVYNKYLGKEIAVPCGHCSACKSLKASNWASRLEMESQIHKYTLFVTLTYGGYNYVPKTHIEDLINSDYTSKTLNKAIENSTEYLKLHDGYIYHHSVAHIQGFIKRLRINLVRKLNLKEDERQIRYYVAFEYGPSGFMPHYHMLLWFSSDKVAQAIKRYIFEAWKSNTCWTRYEDFARINKMSFVRTSCSQYVASYINTDSHIPAILREAPFRQRHLQSQCPSIGSSFIQQRQIQKLFFGDASKIGFVKPTTGRFVTLPLWRGFESRYFARCPKYSSLTTLERIALYKFSSTFGLIEDYSTFKKRFYREWETVFFKPDIDCLGIAHQKEIPQLWLLYKRCFTTEERDGFVYPLESAVRRWFYISRRLRKLRAEWSVSVFLFVSRVEEYYRRKDYDSLKAQLEFEQSFNSNQQLKAAGMRLSYLPYLIDPLFYDNVRHLPTSTYQTYLEQFGVSSEFLSLPPFSPIWKSKKVFYDKIMMENTKVRVHKEFVVLHPEYSKVYLQNRLFYATFR